MKKRSPYAPVRPGATIDWAAEQAAVSAARAEMARVDEAARTAAISSRMDLDPMSQLVKRCHAIEVEADRRAQVLADRIAALEDRIAGMEDGAATEQESTTRRRWRK